jgi:MinD superfamily P-loop ATPase
MNELVVISGKGGTGKTSVLASFAALAKDAVLADCDVDAADLHLVLNPAIEGKGEFKSGHEAVIRSQDCTRCGVCLTHCRFDAITKENGTAPDETVFTVDPVSCEGCGVCVHFCPVHVISFPERVCGEWFVSTTRFGPMVHARLAIAAENSGRLVSLVRKGAKLIAEQQGRNLILVDGPPGIGCPVISSLTGATAVLAVTEPTLSGEHDLERVLSLAGHFRIRTAVCVNKWDINADATQRIERRAVALGAVIVGRIPYDRAVTDAQVQGKTVVEHGDGPAARGIRQTWGKLWQTIS